MFVRWPDGCTENIPLVGRGGYWAVLAIEASDWSYRQGSHQVMSSIFRANFFLSTNRRVKFLLSLILFPEFQTF